MELIYNKKQDDLKYYKISIISSPLEPFIYKTKQNIKHGVVVDVVFNNREAKGVVISTCQKPEFQTSDILGVNDFYFSQKQMELAGFISAYYICSIGDALALMIPYENFSLSLQNKEARIATSQNELKLSQKQSQVLEFLKQHKVYFFLAIPAVVKQRYI